MNKKEVLEIRKQFTPENCAITRIAGCYVDGEKEKRIDYKCSHCGKEYIVSKDNKPKYCSECGRYIDWDEAVHGMQN